jgi:biotin carboxyl carrier protein
VRDLARLRVTVRAAQPVIVQPEPAEAELFAPAGLGEAVSELAPSTDEARLGQRRFEALVDGWRFEVLVEAARLAELREKASRAAAGQQAHAIATLRAQIPGRVVRVWVSEGEEVEQGQRLLAVEAMKMENEIRAPQAGIVEGLRVELDQKVERGDELLSIG